MDVASAEQELESIQRLFRVLDYPPKVPGIWQRIVTSHKVLAKQAHDAHLAAIMQAHSITFVLTFNGSDFARYPGITVLDPMQV